MFLFPNKEIQPDIVKNWLAIDKDNTSLQRKEKYFPLFTRSGVNETMHALASAAKQRILENNPLDTAIAMFDSIKKNPTSKDEEAHQLIEAFWLPQNTHFNVPPNNEKLRAKQLEQLTQLKTLALSGVPVAIQFYRGLLSVIDKETINLDNSYNHISCHCSDEQRDTDQHTCLLYECISHTREVALQIKDAGSLMHIYSMKKSSPLHIDLEDSFFCLVSAAQMEGVDAAKAACCLASYDGSEASEDDNSYVSNLVKEIMSAIKDQTISDEQGIKNLRALENMGSVLAADILLRIDWETTFNKQLTIADIFSQYRKDGVLNPLRYSNKKAVPKELFSTYFRLTFDKIINVGWVTLAGSLSPGKKK